MNKEAMNLLTMTDEDLVKHASKQVQALRMALDMIECEKHDRRHVRWAIIDALKEEAEQPAQRTWVGLTKAEVDLWKLPDHPTVFEFTQFVEAKLKEKNQCK